MLATTGQAQNATTPAPTGGNATVTNANATASPTSNAPANNDDTSTGDGELGKTKLKCISFSSGESAATVAGLCLPVMIGLALVNNN